MLKKIIKIVMKRIPSIEYKIRYLNYLIFIKKRRNFTIKDKQKYLDTIYNEIFNRKINWEKPKCYTEKIQYYKLFDSEKMNHKKADLTDKYKVREWISNTIGEKYLIPLLGVYDSFNDILLSDLPKCFVIKCNHDSGSTVVVDDKDNVNWKLLRRKYEYLMKIDYSLISFEQHYHYIQPKIIIEQDMRVSNAEIADYKLLCFHGKVKYCWVDIDRYKNHKRNVYDKDWVLQDWNQENYGNSLKELKKPENFDKMIEIAEKLSAGFTHVRVDLYNINGRVYFGEMTFTNGSGFEMLNPDNIDYMLGDLW